MVFSVRKAGASVDGTKSKDEIAPSPETSPRTNRWITRLSDSFAKISSCEPDRRP